MPDPTPPSPEARFEPRAARAMADMFDGVSARYDLLNRVMTLGRDASWRDALAREVPDDAVVVLDLCTGSGVSLTGLRQPGRLVVGMDVSVRMLHLARDEHGRHGWAPRLACADAMRLPIRDGSVDCVTIAFGLRNLRPRPEALAEIRRVLRPGGRLLVLEATAPAPGPLAPLHRFYLTRVVPLAGRLSPDPTAYAYLGRSILEFGTAAEFDRDLAAAGFEPVLQRAFLFGATGLWGAERPAAAAPDVQPARSGQSARGKTRTLAARRIAEWRLWNGVQLAISVSILLGLCYGLWYFGKSSPDLPLDPEYLRAGRLLFWAAIAGFALRSVVLAWRMIGAPPRG